MNRLILTLLLTFCSGLSVGKELITCYKAYFFILPVAESCIKYTNEGKNIRVESFIKTTKVGSLFYKIDNFGVSIFKENTKDYDFFLLQEEGSYIRDIYYHKNDNKLHMFITKYAENKISIIKTYYKVHYTRRAVDPITASILLYCKVFKRKSGNIKVFYDGIVYTIPFFVIGYEKSNRKKLLIVELTPKIYTKGIIKPTGKWLLWIDPDTRIPVRMKLEFTVGSALVKLEDIKGYRKVLKELKMCK